MILSNMPGATDDKQKTNDTYAAERKQIHDAGADVIDRFMPSGHIGHNKFQVLDKGGPQAVLFGSTNWTSNALCAQTNNSIIARSPALAAAYKDYWERLKSDTHPPGKNGKAQQSSAFREENEKAIPPIALEDGSGTVDLWFSPNTPKARGRTHGPNETRPPDLSEVFDIIAKAQAGGPVPRLPARLTKHRRCRGRGVEGQAIAVRARRGDRVAGIGRVLHGNSWRRRRDKPQKHQKGDPPLPEDYRVIRAQGITANDAFGQWEKELNQAGHAIIHDKIVVVDPFSDNCVVVTGSHNFGYAASYNNDENMAIIHDHRAIAEAYAAHCLDVYDHYAWRYWLSTEQGQGLALPRFR